MVILSRAQAQTAISVIGRKPLFNNKRLGYRTWKWYCDGKSTAQKLAKRNIPVHSSDEGQVTIVVPLDYSLSDFTAPTPSVISADKTFDRISRAVAFEKMMSYRPRMSSNLCDDCAPCLRDMVFDYYCGVYKDTDKADAATKKYISKIWEKTNGDSQQDTQ